MAGFRGSGGRVLALDALRGILACVVVADHVLLTRWGSRALALPAYCAVLLFFVMSGLVLARSYDRRPWVFLIRRFLRLWPLYAMCLVAGYGLVGKMPPAGEFFWVPLPPDNGLAHINPPVWTLILEAWATPVLPLLFWVAERGRLWILMATVLSLGLVGLDRRLFCLFFLAAGVAASRFDIAWPQRLPAWSLWLGKISYSLYLTHGLVLLASLMIVGRNGPLLSLPFIFAIAWLAWILIERPTIHLSRKPLTEANFLLLLSKRSLPFFLAGLLLAPVAQALESAPVTSKRLTATLISDVDSLASGKPFHLGLRLVMAPGWHTYWSNPGDAGAPPSIEVTGAAAGPLQFPAPERLHEGSFTSFAYTGEVVLPMTATAASGHIEAHAEWLVCAQVCVPEQGHFVLDLPPGSGAAGAQAGLFAATFARIPRPSPFAAHVTPDGVLWLTAPSLPARAAEFFPAEPGIIDQGAAARLTISADRLQVALKPLKTPVGGLPGVLRLTDAGGQVENLSVAPTPLALPGPAPGGTGLARALLLAFAGGLILNLMPCVLPVLAIKALALARLSGAARSHVRAEAAFYTLGVLVAFAAIGGVTLAARAAGDAAGWGIQFQSAAFTTATGWLLFAIGLNLSGVFMVGGRLAGTGQSLAARGSFFTGLLAVVVATPCTAPFMGAALAAALAMRPLAGMLIFLALGMGLAAPYAALALLPGAARVLPKPGAWMDVLKHLLAFPMYAAALWMIWVASQQTGPAGLAAVLASFLLVAFAAWSFGAGQAIGDARLPMVASAGGLAAGLGLLAFVAWSAPAASAARGGASDGSEPFSPERLAAVQAAHHPVLVDMSAAWCVTCLVNERIALSPPSVRAAFAAHHAAYLKGDWTRQDSAITAYLKAFDRSGVPLYVFYPKDGPAEVLPQILTAGLILDRLQHSGS